MLMAAFLALGRISTKTRSPVNIDKLMRAVRAG